MAIRDANFEVNPAVVYREIEGQVLLMLPGEHDLYTLNNTGKLVWQAIVDQIPLSEVFDAIAARYDIPVALVVQDAQRLIDDLVAHQVITEME